MNLIEQRLLELRKEYKTANDKRRKEILFTVGTIKRSKYLSPATVEDKFKKEVKEALL